MSTQSFLTKILGSPESLDSQAENVPLNKHIPNLTSSSLLDIEPSTSDSNMAPTPASTVVPSPISQSSADGDSKINQIRSAGKLNMQLS